MGGRTGRGRYTPPRSILQLTTPHGGDITTPRIPRTQADRDADLLRAAFRDLHGARLHGFALLVALGARQLASEAAAASLAAGARQAGALRHPERAAAWLRRDVVRRVQARRHRIHREAEAERRAALQSLGAAEAAIDGLTALSLTERVALVAADVERFSPIDVETICDSSPGATMRTVLRTRTRYLAAIGRQVGDTDTALGAGPIAARIREAAARTMGGPTGGVP